MSFFDNMDSENKTWLGIVASVCGLLAVVAVCCCAHCTVSEIYNPQPRYHNTIPTIKARLVPVEDR